MTRSMDDRFESHELAFDGRIVKGYAVSLRMADGTVVDRDYLHYPGAAVILPVLPSGDIVFIRNRRFAVDEHLLELPAGTLEAGEDPARCAARELTEETGYTARTLVRLGSFYSSPGASDEMLHAFLATDLVAGDQALEVHEEIVVETFDPVTVRGMCLAGSIHDGKTLATLGLYWASQGDA
jgi:ADP-ribose pyrophosphatase